MRQTAPVKRYALARNGATAQARRDEGVRRLRLVRMEAIVALDRKRDELAAEPAARAALSA